MIICEGCGAAFCPDDAQPHDAPRRFCSRPCRMTTKKRRQRHANPGTIRAQDRRWRNTSQSVNAQARRRRNCSRKRAFPAMEAAAAAWFAIPARTGGVYPCTECPYWHITSHNDLPGVVVPEFEPAGASPNGNGAQHG